ncbi:peptidoglycan-binding domain-containing protein [Frondihabitans cladoniiphilus]|uniref:Peptidoglycan binding-like domain-containing protein n=1 Tax=Frondihabitans cladoniiphilus TaxID=715785 RepID=A0ABP8VZV9_9MICO
MRKAVESSLVPVSQRTDDDEREVQIDFETGGPRPVAATRAGVLTELACSTGGVLRSGRALASIDGVPITALATAQPLWRDIAFGDRGKDVRALQSELANLGQMVRADGIAGRSTLDAAARILRAAGFQPDRPMVVSRDSFAWIPAREIVIRSCEASIGAEVDSGTPLLTLPVELKGARLSELPTAAAAGQRVLDIGTATVPISPDGVVQNGEDLVSIAATTEFSTALSDAGSDPRASARWRLAEPVEVSVIPPTALVGVEDGLACVFSDSTLSTAVAVRVVGSDLGQTFVDVLDDVRLEKVVASPRVRTCP